MIESATVYILQNFLEVNKALETCRIGINLLYYGLF